MTLTERLHLLVHIARWRLTWSRRDLDYLPTAPVSGLFVTARDVAARIPEGASVVSCGMAGNARCSIFFWAIREAFQQQGHPKGLTWINVGAQGGRGRVPGTVEELALPGLVTRYITGHHETAKALLALADEGHLHLYTLPQGVMTRLLEAQGRGENVLRSEVGVGTFLDPRVGRGAVVTPGAPEAFIEAEGEVLAYELPRVEVALFNAPYADAEGNIYFRHAATITENIQAARAARANGGQVFAAVSAIIPKNEAEIAMSADEVDAIVVNPRNEQTGSIPQQRYWPMFTVNGGVEVQKAVEQLKFINTVLHITPVRDLVGIALARLAASRFVQEVPPGAMVNIGVGFPEEVVRLIFEHGLDDDLVFTTETGVYGGLPTPGIFFGAAINPVRLETSAWMFEQYRQRLGATVLGFLQVDSEGNVNVSRRGPHMRDYVGPGGFPDIVDGAKTLFFVGTWMAKARFGLEDGKVAIKQPGRVKFVERVDEITLSGKQALKKGKKVFYITTVGIFQLTEQGLMLVEVMPGVDVQRDILDVSAARIILPEDGPVPVIDRSVVTGEGFTLHWPSGSS